MKKIYISRTPLTNELKIYLIKKTLQDLNLDRPYICLNIRNHLISYVLRDYEINHINSCGFEEFLDLNFSDLRLIANRTVSSSLFRDKFPNVKVLKYAESKHFIFGTSWFRTDEAGLELRKYIVNEYLKILKLWQK